MSRRFDDALNDCLERMGRGEELHRCVALYPKFREELLPLLRAAHATRITALAAAPDPAVKARVFQRMMTARRPAETRGRWRVPQIVWKPAFRPLLAALAVVFLMALAAGGTTAAASNSLPGDPLYWVKTTRENITLMMPRSDVAKSELHLELAGERSSEIQQLAAGGRYADAESAVSQLEHHLNQFGDYAKVAQSSPAIEMPLTAARIERLRLLIQWRGSLEREDMALRASLTQQLEQPDITPHVRERLRNIIRQSESSYRILLDVLAESEFSSQP